MFLRLLDVLHSFPFSWFLIVFASWLFLHYRDSLNIHLYSFWGFLLLVSSLFFEPEARWFVWFPSSSISLYTIFFLCIQELFHHSQRYKNKDFYNEHRIVFQKSIKEMTTAEMKFDAYKKAIVINKKYFATLDTLYGKYNSFFIFWLLSVVSALHIIFFGLDFLLTSTFTSYLENSISLYQSFVENLGLDEKQHSLLTSFIDEYTPTIIEQMNRWFVLYSMILVLSTFILVRLLMCLVLKKEFLSIRYLGSFLFFELKPIWVYILIILLSFALGGYYLKIPSKSLYFLFNIVGVLLLFSFLHGYSYLKLYSAIYFVPLGYFVFIMFLFTIFFSSFVLIMLFVSTCILTSFIDFWLNLRKRTLQSL